MAAVVNASASTSTNTSTAHSSTSEEIISDRVASKSDAAVCKGAASEVAVEGEASHARRARDEVGSNLAANDAAVSDAAASDAAASDVTASDAAVSEAAARPAAGMDTAASAAASQGETLLLQAVEDDSLCEHFRNEPAVTARNNVRIVRVGQPGNTIFGIRAKSIGITTFKKYEALWAVDKHEEAELLFARIRDPQGSWSPILQAPTANALSRCVLDRAGASKKTKMSARDFFGVQYFEKLGNKQHKFPPPSTPPKCFSCSGSITGQPRYQQETLARLCDSSRCRNRKRKLADSDEEDGVCCF